MNGYCGTTPTFTYSSTGYQPRPVLIGNYAIDLQQVRFVRFDLEADDPYATITWYGDFPTTKLDKESAYALYEYLGGELIDQEDEAA